MGVCQSFQHTLYVFSWINGGELYPFSPKVTTDAIMRSSSVRYAAIKGIPQAIATGRRLRGHWKFIPTALVAQNQFKEVINYKRFAVAMMSDKFVT